MNAYINGAFVSYEKALIHISDLSIQRAYALFDFFRTVNGRPLFMEDHLDRFYASAEAMHLAVGKERGELKEIIGRLLENAGLQEAGVRLMLTGGYSEDGYQPAKPNLVLTCKAIKTATEADFEKGFRIITYEHRRELPQVKSINYLTAVWLQPLLREKGADDVLYEQDGIISEFPRSNVFIVTKENILVTPSRYMLRGITRKQVLQLAGGIMEVEERDILTSELLYAREVFLTATSKKILPVLHINGHSIAGGQPGEVTRELYKKFLELEKEIGEKSESPEDGKSGR